MTDVTIILDERTAERLQLMMPRLLALTCSARQRHALTALQDGITEGIDTNDLRERIASLDR